jgi:hypothetical protein
MWNKKIHLHVYTNKVISHKQQLFIFNNNLNELKSYLWVTFFNFIEFLYLIGFGDD